jgi:cytochrome c oxidase subunit 2
MSSPSPIRLSLAALVAAVALAGCGGSPAVDPSLSPEAQRGSEVSRAVGCTSCHGERGAGVVGLGPPIIGLIGTEATLTDGRVVVIDSEYLRRGVVDPGADLLVDWEVPMPLYDLTQEELQALLAYMTEAR